MYSNTTNPNYYAKRIYGTQRGLEEGKYKIYTDSTKYTPDEALYKQSVERNFSKLFESQFYKTIKTPEQAKLIQQSVANDGR